MRLWNGKQKTDSVSPKKTTGFVPFLLCLIISYKSVFNEDKLQKKDISTSFDVVFNWTKRSNCLNVSFQYRRF
jgi:hypothetical protein